MKENKNKTFKQKIFDDPQGKIEEFVFYFPRNSEVNYFLDEYAIDYDLTQDLDNNLPMMYSDKDKIEHEEQAQRLSQCQIPTQQKQRSKIQVHSAKKLDKSKLKSAQADYEA